MKRKNHSLYMLGIVTCLLFILTSCSTSKDSLAVSRRPGISSTTTRLNVAECGIDRLKEYTVVHTDIPKSFDGKTILFISDTHYPSLFKTKDLNALISYLKTLNYDIMCLGGDYHENTSLIDTLFDRLGEVKPAMGAYGVMGNNDYERGYDVVAKAMQRNGIQLLEHKVDTIKYKGSFIQVVGIKNPFNLTKNGISPTLGLSDKDFVVLLTHTPDYAEDVVIRNSDLVLAGHTHGGQVRIFGVAPIVPSKYDQKFLTGLVYNSVGIPMIVTNGIGTSNKNIRIGAPSEVVLIHLKSIR